MIETQRTLARRTAKRGWIAAAASLVCTPLLAQPAAAPTPPPTPAKGAPAAGQPAPKVPVDITADHQDFYNDENKTIYTGNVEVIQGTDRMRTPKLTIYFLKKDQSGAPKPAPAAGGEADGGRKIEHMEAEGPVYFANPTQNGRGDHGVYTAADKTTVITGNVVLVQGKNVSTGDKLVMNQITNQAQLYSGQSSQRVRGVFYQQDQTPPTSAAPPSTKPAKSSSSKSH
jgi:lipopolysaccharide export system protein LptA